MSKHRIPNEKWMEFISEIAIQLTESEYGEYTYVWNHVDGEDKEVFSEEANRYYHSRYDEVETLLENTLGITNDKPEYYERKRF